MYGIRSSAEKTAGKQLKEILEHMSPSTCRIGFWTSDIISSETQFPLKMRKPIVWNAAPPPKPTTSGKAPGHLDRNVMCIVEIWSKNPRIDAKNRLIARQIQHNNVYMDIDATHSDWFYGGKTLESPASIGNPFDTSKLSSLGGNSVPIDSPNRRNDKLHSKLSATKQISPAGSMPQYPKPHPFSTWMSPASLYGYVPIKTQQFPKSAIHVGPNLTKPKTMMQPSSNMSPSYSAPSLSVFKYKFRWHVKTINRKSLISRDGGSSLPNENTISGLTAAAAVAATSAVSGVSLPAPVFGYHDEDDDLSALNLTAEGCSQGYQGADCSVPVCLAGCDQDHGYVATFI